MQMALAVSHVSAWEGKHWENCKPGKAWFLVISVECDL